MSVYNLKDQARVFAMPPHHAAILCMGIGKYVATNAVLWDYQETWYGIYASPRYYMRKKQRFYPEEMSELYRKMYQRWGIMEAKSLAGAVIGVAKFDDCIAKPRVLSYEDNMAQHWENKEYAWRIAEIYPIMRVCTDQIKVHQTYPVKLYNPQGKRLLNKIEQHKKGLKVEASFRTWYNSVPENFNPIKE